MSSEPFATPSSGTRTPSESLGRSIATTLAAFGLPNCDANVRPLFEAVKQIEKQGTALSELPVCEPAEPNPTLVRAVASIGVMRVQRQDDIAYHLASNLRAEHATRR